MIWAGDSGGTSYVSDGSDFQEPLNVSMGERLTEACETEFRGGEGPGLLYALRSQRRADLS